MSAVARALVASGRGATGIVSAGLRGAGVVSAGLSGAGVVTAGLHPTGIVTAGLHPTGIVTAGLHPTKIVTPGLNPTRIVTGILRGSGTTVLRRTGTISSGGSSGIGGLRRTCVGPSGRGDGVGFLARAPGSARHFSSSSSSTPLKEKFRAKWDKYKPGEDIMICCTLLGAGTGLIYIIDTGYKVVLNVCERTSKAYIDENLKGMQGDLKDFKNIATGTHHEFVRECNQVAAATQGELSHLRSRMLALEQKEFEHRKELLIAAEVLRKAGLDAAAGAAAKNIE